MLAAETAADLRQRCVVNCLHKYIATWRGIATDLELLRDFSSVSFTGNTRPRISESARS